MFSRSRLPHPGAYSSCPAVTTSGRTPTRLPSLDGSSGRATGASDPVVARAASWLVRAQEFRRRLNETPRDNLSPTDHVDLSGGGEVAFLSLRAGNAVVESGVAVVGEVAC